MSKNVRDDRIRPSKAYLPEGGNKTADLSYIILQNKCLSMTVSCSVNSDCESKQIGWSTWNAPHQERTWNHGYKIALMFVLTYVLTASVV
jgi:hypothetical protein